jgi:hypothetical protein
LIRLLGVVVFGVVTFCVTGCGSDNESEAEKAKALGNPGAANPKSTPDTPQQAPAADYSELSKRSQDPTKNMMKQGYPKR